MTSLEWREHKIGFVADLYSLCTSNVVKGQQLYQVRHNGLLIKLSSCSLDEAKAFAQRHYDKA